MKDRKHLKAIVCIALIITALLSLSGFENSKGEFYKIGGKTVLTKIVKTQLPEKKSLPWRVLDIQAENIMSWSRAWAMLNTK